MAYLLQAALNFVHEAFTAILIAPSGNPFGNLVPILDVTIVGLRNE